MWSRVSTNGGMFAKSRLMTAGAVGGYLIVETYQYEQFSKEMASLSTTEASSERPLVQAEHKEYLIFGRQSPGYVRDDHKSSKNYILEQIKISSISIAKIGTHLDNESHYDLLKSSPFITEPLSHNSNDPRVIIQPEQMIDIELKEIPDEQRYEISFARKQAFATTTDERSPFYHSSFALRAVSEHRPANSNAVVISGKEAKELISDINKTICEAQHCTMYTSNCYSASIYGLGVLATIIDQRDCDEERKKLDIQAIANVASKFSTDNFARGVSNNAVVNAQMTSVLPKIMSKYDLLERETDEQILRTATHL
ncbi:MULTISPECIES: hypothetical protein [Legionella]|uniref:Uncharacterized protein n=1 Tax=Legionella resiliens TaxID=2905958 RepID=A0ABS8X4U5_9GAMM|nr:MULTISPECIES: hypothetical protein [unclassified Legionella]MCE0723611.1 hypothetical protein [Legionella sp. 9fVS26]MCE3532764.1 hypothetical protein [Legionella sp. 8cVS16]QLZ68899.1 hypothetical protein FOLKNPGA_01679 [Legionella sp. PC1000]